MLSQLTRILNRPLKIGCRTIPNRLVLAPMTFLGHVAFRQVLAEFGGCGLMFSEMCSAGRIPNEDRRVSAYFRWRDEEASMLAFQIVGNHPEKMVRAAERIESEGLWGVDINLGCSATSICRHNQGAAMLKDVRAAVEMVDHVRRSVKCPVTVKFRTGWQDDPRIPVDLARRLEEVGVDALTFHPRVAPDRRNRPPKWAYIGLVKEAVSIPVFGNGDVFDARDCLKMMQNTDCDGVALGRIAIAQPWLFAQWTQGQEPSTSIHLETAMRLLDAIQVHFDTVSALRRMKRYSTYLAANFVFGNTLYNRIRIAKDMGEVKNVLLSFLKNNPQQLQRPNQNFMR